MLPSPYLHLSLHLESFPLSLSLSLTHSITCDPKTEVSLARSEKIEDAKTHSISLPPSIPLFVMSLSVSQYSLLDVYVLVCCVGVCV